MRHGSIPKLSPGVRAGIAAGVSAGLVVGLMTLGQGGGEVTVRNTADTGVEVLADPTTTTAAPTTTTTTVPAAPTTATTARPAQVTTTTLAPTTSTSTTVSTVGTVTATVTVDQPGGVVEGGVRHLVRVTATARGGPVGGARVLVTSTLVHADGSPDSPYGIPFMFGPLADGDSATQEQVYAYPGVTLTAPTVYEVKACPSAAACTIAGLPRFPWSP